MARDALDQHAAQDHDEHSTAPVTEPNARVAEIDDDEMPRVHVTRRQVIIFAVLLAALGAFIYFVVPQIHGVKEAWDHVTEGDHVWLAIGLGFLVLSIVSYVAIFHGIHVPPGSPLTHGDSYLITMAGLAATRLFAAGGAGGVAVTAWALRRSGMERREVAERMIAFLLLLYGVYAAAMIICGVGLRTGLFNGPAPFGLTVVPAIIMGIGFVIAALIGFLPEDLERRIEVSAARRPRTARVTRRLATAPASTRGAVRFAVHKTLHPDLAMIGTISWWAFNVAILWAAFRAFGNAPPTAVLVQAFLVGMLANLLPIPGGIGGVDGGMIGALAAFGVDAGVSVLAVLTYRLFAFWLPTVPGVIAYFQLRRRVRVGWAERRAAV